MFFSTVAVFIHKSYFLSLGVNSFSVFFIKNFDSISPLANGFEMAFCDLL